MPATQNSLGIDIEDADDLIVTVEHAFGIRFADREFGNAAQAESLTMGELYDHLAASLKPTVEARRVCLSMAAFHKLRRAAVACGGERRPGLNAELKTLLGRRNLRRTWAELRRQSGFDLPTLRFAAFSHQVIWACVLLIAALTAATGTHLTAVIGFVSTFLLSRLLPVEVPDTCATLADLTRYATAYNFGKLSREYKVAHPADVWAALVRIADDHALHSGAISRDMRCFDHG